MNIFQATIRPEAASSFNGNSFDFTNIGTALEKLAKILLPILSLICVTCAGYWGYKVKMQKLKNKVELLKVLILNFLYFLKTFILGYELFSWIFLNDTIWT